MNTLELILDLARWAPSADNTQPWRFELNVGGSLTVHGFDTRDSCVYDRDGRISQLALGALLETIRIAATAHGLDCTIAERSEMPDARPTFDVRFSQVPLSPNPLVDYIKIRSVQRRALNTRSLTIDQQKELESIVGTGYQVRWLSSFSERFHFAKLLFLNGRLRLRLPEAFEVHRKIIDWNARESIDRIPDAAIGLDPISLRLTRWAFASWDRVSFLNKYLGGTLLPCVELDFLPALACAAHFVILARTPPREMHDYVGGGAALQRFWLTATRLGLFVQPEASPLVFARYYRQGRRFTSSKPCEILAGRVTQRLTELIGHDSLDHAVFMGRIGSGRAPKARSTRLPLGALYQHGPGRISSEAEVSEP